MKRCGTIATFVSILAVVLLVAWHPSAARVVESSMVAPPLGASQNSDNAPAVATKGGAAIQCFWTDGVYGQITVTTSGAGCGTPYTYGGISGFILGDENVDESCTFTISPAVAGTLGTVAMTAHSCVPDQGCEKTRFRLNGVDYDVVESDVDQNTPPGGSDVVVLPSGEVEGSAVDGDGRATIMFNSAPGPVTTIEIDHMISYLNPNGTIYLVCFDDVPVELMTIEVE